MTTNPAITALGLIQAAERRLIAGPDDDGRAYDEEVWSLLADPDDHHIHADYAAKVATELATIVIGIAVRADYPLDQLVADYRRQMHARGDDT